MLGIILPGFLIWQLIAKFDGLKEKEIKRKFNTLILKIDKDSKWRVLTVTLFFVRRIFLSFLLTMDITSQYVFMQYVLLLVTCHVYILYLVANKPW